MVSQELLKKIKSPTKSVITFHQNPDGDAIGSALGFAVLLDKLGHDCAVVSPNEVGEYLRWLEGSDRVLNYENETKTCNETISDAEMVYCLDFNDLNRVGQMEHSLKKKLKSQLTMIDHHLLPKDFAKYTLHDSSAPATALLIYRIYEEIDKSLLTLGAAEALYTGLMTDTGSFRFPSTSAEVHRAVAYFLEIGLQHHIIHESIYDNFSPNKLKLFGKCFSQQHEMLPEHATSFMYVTMKDDEDFGIEKGDTEGLVNYNLSLAGVKFGVLFIEKEDMIKISFRSKGDFPANEFARKYFQGGGHLNAAGGRSFLSLKKTIQKFKDKLNEFEA